MLRRFQRAARFKREKAPRRNRRKRKVNRRDDRRPHHDEQQDLPQFGEGDDRGRRGRSLGSEPAKPTPQCPDPCTGREVGITKYDYGERLSAITCIIVNYKTPDIIETALTTFDHAYPDLTMTLIDNGSLDRSTQIMREFARRPSTNLIVNATNVGHGPAMHQGILATSTPFAFTMDSDCEVVKGGFLELMLDEFDQDLRLYAIGWLRWTNGNGVPYRIPGHGIRNIHPSAMLLDVEKYKTLPKFSSSGAPTTRNMAYAVAHDYHLKDFPISDYILHMGAGTRGLFHGHWRPTGQPTKERSSHRV